MEPSTFEMILQGIYLMIQYQDLRKLIREGKFNDYVEEIGQRLMDANMLYSPIYLKFVDSIKCINCEARCDIVLQCNHQFCFNCISKIIDQNGKKCPSCLTNINASDLELIYPTEKDFEVPNEMTQSTRIKMKKLNNEFICKICNLHRDFDKFYYSCNHICLYCGFKSIANQKSCKVCNCKILNQHLKKYQKEILCAGCNKMKYITENKMFDICENHPHCYKCLLTVWNTMRCLECKKSLDFKGRKALKLHMFFQCKICENLLEEKFIVEKGCCESPVCLACQKQNGDELCVQCNNKLGAVISKRLKALTDNRISQNF